ncbi:MAG: hypothetical protein CVV64_05850 [Candidatus Wallbacteria bacterium HGW-Wallbacteria-1]|uniref:Uncharacterized protein n=1 Tax=Candidatus Wallbacteria bacterium HGW-Wallbacteria-1 TaxID=2013854 RepID=A0A2N1PSG6_9BACT|nr:MAG: hypothetical protein CVV64_05850 [Candidatus Wallbacteria bacterium HGW-Wallbacteria-1]
MAGTPRVLTQDGQGGSSDGSLRTEGNLNFCLVYLKFIDFTGLWTKFGIFQYPRFYRGFKKFQRQFQNA